MVQKEMQRRLSSDLGQENVGADAGDEQVGVLAEPAGATARGGSPVEHPAVVDVSLGFVSVLPKHRDQRRHFFRQHLVVVATERVAGDPSSGRPVDGLGGGGKWVRKGERDHALRLGRRPARIRAGVHAVLTPPGEAVHQAGAGALGRGCLRLDKWIGSRYPGGNKSKLTRPRLDVIRQRHGPILGTGDRGRMEACRGAQSGGSFSSS